jgi:hypothetical protein
MPVLHGHGQLIVAIPYIVSQAELHSKKSKSTWGQL